LTDLSVLAGLVFRRASRSEAEASTYYLNGPSSIDSFHRSSRRFEAYSLLTHLSPSTLTRFYLLTMAIESRHRNNSNHIILTPLPEQNRTTRQRRRRKRHHSSPTILLAFAAASFLVGFHLNRGHDFYNYDAGRRRIESSTSKEWTKEWKTSLRQEDSSIRPADNDDVVNFLMKLAEKRPGDLWSLFGMDGGERWVLFILLCSIDWCYFFIGLTECQLGWIINVILSWPTI
jgi:hypothetical protein